MNEKYLYFRTVGDAADDDDDTSSCLVPVSKLRGSWTLSSTTTYITFHSIHDVRKVGGSTRDGVAINVGAGRVPDFLEDLYKEISTGENIMITVGDDVTSEYISSHITSIGTITITTDDT
tara:strand:- start:235 stop:594 length:360 start_codon:yes stop_codon:yes gene_type:complete